jgi:hypothetical protein
MSLSRAVKLMYQSKQDENIKSVGMLNHWVFPLLGIDFTVMYDNAKISSYPPIF